MSILNPMSTDELRTLARESRTRSLSRNELHELERACGQSGPLGRELKQIMKGEA